MIRLRKILTNWVALAIYVAALVVVLPLTASYAFWGALTAVAVAVAVARKWGGGWLSRLGGNSSRWIRRVARLCRYVYLLQIRGKVTVRASQASHHCLNCGYDFVGNFCPCCGQSGSVAQTIRFGGLMKHIALSLMKFGSGMGHTITDLLWRPGFMVRNYLQGRRMSYASPFLTLVFFLVLTAFVKTYLNIEQKPLKISFNLGQKQENPTSQYQMKTDAKRLAMDIETEKGVVTLSSDSTMSRVHGAVDSASQRWTVVGQLWKTAKEMVTSNSRLLHIIGIMFPPLIIAFALLFRRHAMGGRRLNLTEYFVVQCYVISLLFIASLLLYPTGNSSAGIISSLLLALIAVIRQLFDGFTWPKATLYALLVATIAFAIAVVAVILGLLGMFVIQGGLNYL